MIPLWLVLGVIVLQRLGELALAHRNTRRLLAAGGREVGAGHYPLLVGLHAAWMVAIAGTIPLEAPAEPAVILMLAALQAFRLWVIGSLGRFWTTRIVTVPEAPLVARGPYRLVRHPNYLVVAGEIALVPLAFGAWPLAVAFSAANGALLALRVAVEEAALASRPRLTARGTTGAAG
ncbi:MAG: isoprenylcysteine carboxyl methyltransferase family protein [Solirubrobacterales bacterium]